MYQNLSQSPNAMVTWLPRLSWKGSVRISFLMATKMQSYLFDGLRLFKNVECWNIPNQSMCDILMLAESNALQPFFSSFRGVVLPCKRRRELQRKKRKKLQSTFDIMQFLQSTRINQPIRTSMKLRRPPQSSIM